MSIVNCPLSIALPGGFMKLAVDLHIHSALSPCADNEMTPNNIANMAYLKGLDIIAVTDHNSVENCEAVIKCAQKSGIIAVPGMELETREEVHLICLFPGLGEALDMQKIVYEALPDMKNREDIFGQQLIMDENDNITEKNSRFLVTAADMSIDNVFEYTGKLNGVVVPAHIDRQSYSLISNLGIIPEYLNIKFLEVSRKADCKELLAKHSFLENYKFITSSDAHNLGDIFERQSFIELEEPSIECLINRLKNR